MRIKFYLEKNVFHNKVVRLKVQKRIQNKLLPDNHEWDKVFKNGPRKNLWKTAFKKFFLVDS